MNEIINKIIELIDDFFKYLSNVNVFLNQRDKKINNYQYQWKTFLTNYERYFLEIFKDLENGLSIKFHLLLIKTTLLFYS